MNLILNKNPDGEVVEVILREPTLSDKLAMLFLRKNQEMAFSNPVEYEGEDDVRNDN